MELGECEGFSVFWPKCKLKGENLNSNPSKVAITDGFQFCNGWRDSDQTWKNFVLVNQKPVVQCKLKYFNFMGIGLVLSKHRPKKSIEKRKCQLKLKS